MKFSRAWAMPSGDTFSVAPIAAFVRRYLDTGLLGSIDPFARNSALCDYTNDLNPATAARYHMDAEAFLHKMAADGVAVDRAILDPPYSPRQISECYSAAGLKAGMKDTQNAALYPRVRKALRPLLTPGAIVLSFGWNSAGMGKDFELLEILLVAHGGAHNDTICLAERLRG